MPRDHARVNLSIWNDADFRALPPQAQHLYLVLWTHPELTFAGTVDWRPGRLAALATPWTKHEVHTAADCLRARLFIVTDDDTEEALIRSWVRFDGLMKQPNLGVSFANAYAAVASATIRGVIVHEAHKLRDREPEYPSWGKRQVADLLSQPAIDPHTLDNPADPFTTGLTPAVTPRLTPVVTPAVTLNRGVGVDPTGDTPPTPTPAPTPLLHTVPDADASDATPGKPSRRKPEKPLPAEWAPNSRHFTQAETKGVDIQAEARAFRNHAATHDRRARDWDAAFRTWLDKARPPTGGPAQPRRSPWDALPSVEERRRRDAAHTEGDTA